MFTIPTMSVTDNSTMFMFMVSSVADGTVHLSYEHVWSRFLTYIEVKMFKLLQLQQI